ncbi:hypothetical protein vseg_013262 [Gypsophila vaccaria]
MDTSSPAAFVNGQLLRVFVGRKITIKGSPPPQPLTTFVEVIGIADSNQSVRADTWANFGDHFDASNYNQLCQLANGEYKHLFI